MPVVANIARILAHIVHQHRLHTLGRRADNAIAVA